MRDFVFIFFNIAFDSIHAWDKSIYTAFQTQWHSAWADVIFPILRNKLTWIPLYIVVAFYAFQKHKAHFLHFVLFSIGLVILSDFTCAQLLKPFFERIRPCANPDLSLHFRGLIHCSNGYSMPSCHAMNHAALACFWSLNVLKKYRWYLVIWACSIAFSQVYVGVHYPSDVLVGLVLGTLCGYLGNLVFKKLANESLLESH